MDEKDFTAAPGETVSFAAAVSDPDGDDWTERGVQSQQAVYTVEKMKQFITGQQIAQKVPLLSRRTQLPVTASALP